MITAMISVNITPISKYPFMDSRMTRAFTVFELEIIKMKFVTIMIKNRTVVSFDIVPKTGKSKVVDTHKNTIRITAVIRKALRFFSTVNEALINTRVRNMSNNK
jgi:hypothetical protein